MGNRTAPKEGSHLWIMANMLATLRDDPEQLLLHFLKYAIAACHPKIKRRIKSISSKTHWKCFQSITPDDIQVQASSPRPRQSLEFKNDHNFLCTLAKREIVPDYEACYPNIAAVLPHWATPTSVFELFNNATCKEYHALFINLMSRYVELVDKMAALAAEGKSLESTLGLAVKTGHALLTMVKGRAFHLYLSTIAVKLSSFLPQDTIAVKLSSSLPQDSQIEHDGCDAQNQEHNNEGHHNNEEREEIDNDDVEEERESDGHIVDTGTSLWVPTAADATAADPTAALWKPFKSWIMLILVQFEAANALCDFITGSPLQSKAQIDVKLVYAPLVSDEIIPLEVLLEERYIPPGADPITNANLLNFIKTANKLDAQVQQFDKLLEEWDPIQGAAFLQQVSDEAKKQHREGEHGEQGIDPANTKISMLSDEIIKLLPLLQEDENVIAKFTELGRLLKERKAKNDLPFSEKQTSFKGAIHCEAALGSILDKNTREGILAEIAKHDQESKKKKGDVKKYENLKKLLTETEVGLFSFNLFL